LHPCPVSVDDAVDVCGLEVVEGGPAASGNVDLTEELKDLQK